MGLRGVLMNPIINVDPMDLPEFKLLLAELDSINLRYRFILLTHR